ncbi:MAG: hypothetical protein AAFR59_17675, partial [Bacteroidota bacterium]
VILYRSDLLIFKIFALFFQEKNGMFTKSEKFGVEIAKEKLVKGESFGRILWEEAIQTYYGNSSY